MFDNSYTCNNLVFLCGADPCLDKYCSAGRICTVDDNGEGQCVCVNACESEVDSRRRVSLNAFLSLW